MIRGGKMGGKSRLVGWVGVKYMVGMGGMGVFGDEVKI